MLRLRKKDGATLEIPEGAFVEICSMDGLVAKVVFVDAQGHIHLIDAGDPEAEQYSRLFDDVKFTKTIRL